MNVALWVVGPMTALAFARRSADVLLVDELQVALAQALIDERVQQAGSAR